MPGSAFAAETTTAAGNKAAAVLPGLKAVLPALQRGGLVVYLRHGITDHAGADDSNADMARCETQRNLTDSGRQQASAIGAAIKKLGIPIGSVLSSPFCRCRDTAQLAFGQYTVNDDLYFALDAMPEERRRLAQVLRTLLATPPDNSRNTFIVAHTANLKEAMNLWPKPEGAAYVFQPTPAGAVAVASIAPEEWTQLAGAAP